MTNAFRMNQFIRICHKNLKLFEAEKQTCPFEIPHFLSLSPIVGLANRTSQQA